MDFKISKLVCTALPGHLNFYRFPHCSVQTALMMIFRKFPHHAYRAVDIVYLQLWNLLRELAPFFVIRRNLIREPLENVIKVPFKTNNAFNFYNDVFIYTSNTEQKEQTNRKICVLLQCLTNSHKS